MDHIFFSPESLAANARNIWDVEHRCVQGAYDERFNFVTEEDLMINTAIAHMIVNSLNTKHQSLNENQPSRSIPDTLQKVFWKQ